MTAALTVSNDATPDVTRAFQWVDDVLAGRVIAGEDVIAACRRHVSDMEIGHERGLYFDAEAAQRAVNFYELCPHVKGPLAAKLAIRANNKKRVAAGKRLLNYNPITLADWQAFIVVSLFGWRRLTDEAVNMFFADPDEPKTWPLRFQIAHLCVARKNGKTTMLAPILLMGLCAMGESGAEIYSAATTRDQAKIVWDIANSMIKRGPLGQRIQKRAWYTQHGKSGSEFRPLSSDHDTLDGLNIFIAGVDELHAHKSRGLYEVLESSMGSRASQLLVSITTAGIDRESICYEIESLAREVVHGRIENDALFAMLFTVDKKELDDENALLEEGPHWYKANPNLGVSVSLDVLRSEAKIARESPRKRSNFLRKRLNVWVGAVSAWLNMTRWDQCPDSVPISFFKGAQCWAGLDLSSKRDVASLSVLFRKDGIKYPYLFNWLPRGALSHMSKTHKEMFEDWERSGYLEIVEGDTIDQSLIEDRLQQIREDHDLQCLAFDPWHATRLVSNLHELGWPEKITIQVGQTVRHLSEPMKTLEEWVLNKTIANPRNELLTWALSNVVKYEDKSSNIKPNKETSANKIDPAVALIMSIARELFTPPKRRSVYETRGIRTL